MKRPRRTRDRRSNPSHQAALPIAPTHREGRITRLGKGPSDEPTLLWKHRERLTVQVITGQNQPTQILNSGQNQPTQILN